MAIEEDTQKKSVNSLTSTEDVNSQSVWPLWVYALGLMVMPDNLALSGHSASQSPATAKSLIMAIAFFGGIIILWIITALLHVAGEVWIDHDSAHTFEA